MNQPPPQEEIAAQNQRELQTLNRTIGLCQGTFSVILLRCNYLRLRERMAEQLAEFGPLPIREIHLPTDVKRLYTFIQSELSFESPAALMVSGLEACQSIEKVLASINASRELFRNNFRFPLLLWVTDEVLGKLIRLAPDFYNWASSYQFALTTDELIDFIRQNTDRVFTAVLDVGADLFLPNSTILGSRGYSELESARKELHSRGIVVQPALEASLQFIRGRDDFIHDRVDAALVHYKQSLAFWRSQSRSDRLFRKMPHIPLTVHPSPITLEPQNAQSSLFLERQGVMEFRIGLCYSRKAEMQRDRSRQHWLKARNYLHQGVDSFKQAGRQDLVAKFINQLGSCLRHLKAWEDLHDLAKEALQMHLSSEGYSIQLAQDYGFLSEVALEQSNWTLAKEMAERALNVLAMAPEQKRAIAELLPQHQGLYLLLLARSLRQLGQPHLAVSKLEIARQTSEPLYDPLLYLDILGELRQLYFQRRQYLDAFEIKQEQRAIEAQYGFRAFIGAGCLQPQLQAINPALDPIAHQASLPSEITASRRLQDVNNLLNRISSTQHKLTVIHGQSGVGKSSIVKAGLIPALQQTSISARDVLPIVLPGYTDWVTQLGQLLTDALKQTRNLRLFPSPDSVEEIVEQLSLNGDRNLLTVLIFDQFEEFFFLEKKRDKKQPFFDFLRDCLNIPFVKVVLSMRTDFLHNLLEVTRAANLDAINNDILSKDILYYLGNLSQDEAKSVIKNLTQRSHFYLEEELILQLVQDLASEMGEVRPIELQVVGEQLQTDNITTLEQYRQHGPKAKLVERFLKEVLKDCGPENERAAGLVLYFLTDKNDPRPLKTRDELATELADFEETHKLDLVLKILVRSGFVFLVGEFPTYLYQLVHDYIAAFIRTQQEPDLAELEELRKREKSSKAEIEQLRKEKEMLDKIKKTEARLNLLLKVALVGAIIALIVFASLTWLAVSQTQEAISQRQEAEKARNDALKSASVALAISNENDQLGVLLTSVKIGIESQKTKASSDDKIIIAERLRQAVSRVQEINRFEGHSKSVLSAIFSPNGEMIADAGADNTIKIWRPDGQLIRILTGHKDAVRSVSFSRDGKMLASASADNTIKIWNVDEGKEIRTLKGHSKMVTSVSISADGKMLASASVDNTVKLWNVQNGREIKTLKGHSDWVLGASFSPDGQTIASASADNSIILWKLDGQLLKTLKGHNGVVYSVSFSNDGRTLASASADNTVKLWNVDEGKEIRTLKGHSDEVLAVNFSRDGKTIASGSADDSVKLWSREGTLLNTLRGHQNDVVAVSFSRDGKTIVSASVDKTVKLWRIDSTPLRQTLTGHSDYVYSASFSPDGELIASASYDKTVRLWDRDGTLLKTLEGHEDSVTWVSFSPDGQTIASAGYDKTVKLWSRDGTLLNTLRGHNAPIFNVSFSPKGDFLVTASQDKTVKIWRRDGTLLKTLAHEDSVNSVSFSPQGDLIASASDDTTVKIWRRDGTFLRSLPHGDKVTSVSFSHDGQMLASASAGTDKTVKLWSREGTLIKLLYHNDSVNSVSFSPSGDLIASASADKTVKLWRKDGTSLATLDHTDIVNSLSFSPDGQILALASKDKAVILWRVDNLDLDGLIASGCDWLKDYLKTNPNISDSDRNLCEGIRHKL